MPDAITRAEIESIAKRAIRGTPNAKVSADSVSQKGGAMNILTMGVLGALVDELQARFFGKLAALRRSTARGDELAAIIFEQTFGQVVRLGASTSVLPVTLSRAASGTSGTVAAGTELAFGGVTFGLEADVTWGLTDTSKVATARSRLAGAQSRVAEGGSIAWTNASGLFDPTITLAANGPAAGGEDGETDDQLLARADRWATGLSKATLPAMELAAVQAGARQSRAYEELDAQGQPNGVVLLYVADSDGRANTALVQAVRLALLEARGGGMPVHVVGSSPSLQGIVLAGNVLAGYDPDTVKAAVRARVVGAVNRLAPGETMSRALILATARAVPGFVVNDSTLVAPTADVVPATASQTLRTDTTLVTFQ